MTSLDSWPHGVSSLNDHKRFMKLMFGQEGTDLTEQIPWHKWVGIDDPRKTCFLGFVRNFRTSGRLEEIRDCFGIFDQQMKWETNNGAYFQNAHQMHNVQGSGHRPYYLCAFINGNNCLCNVSFEGSKKWDKCSCSRTANAFPSGRKFEALLTETLKSNWKNCFDNDDNSVTSAPHWLRDGTYHTLLNKSTHARGQGISFHRDSAITYSELDPITSFTLCSPGVLLVKIASDEGRVTSKLAKKYTKCLLIFQEEWDAAVMSGQFQKVLVHCVPERTKWPEILETKAWKDDSDVQCEIANAVDHDPHWAKFQQYCQRLKNDPELAGSHAVRHNVTIRWHRNHLIDSHCPFAKVKVPEPGPLTTQSAAAAVPWTTYPPGWSSSQPSTQAGSRVSVSVDIQSATILSGQTQTVNFVPPGRPQVVTLPRWKTQKAAAASHSAPVKVKAEDSVSAAAAAAAPC